MNCLGFVKKIFPSVRTKKTTSLSSPQRQIRKKAEEQHKKDRESSDEGDRSEIKRVNVRDKRKLKQQEQPANSEEGFKEPQSLNESLEVTYTLTLKKTALELPEVREALDTLRRHGCVAGEETRRKSIESSLSVGGSSGYLGGSSSGTSSSGGGSARSRLSVAPDTEIENHSVRAPLPSLARLTTVEFAPDSAVAQISSQLEEEKEEQQQERGERSSDSEQPSRNKTTPAKRGRKKKTERKVQSGEGAGETSTEPERSRTGTPSSDDKYCPDSKVFAR